MVKNVGLLACYLGKAVQGRGVIKEMLSANNSTAIEPQLVFVSRNDISTQQISQNTNR